MKFFHVYNENCFKGLEKNGFINKDTGFKIQHCFAMPNKVKFNEIAKKDGALYSLLKNGNYPFYVDRIAGGVTYHKYDFDSNLIEEYINLLGDWFLGFQLHESGSNRRNSDWQRILRVMDSHTGPYDLKKLRELTVRDYAILPDDGTVLSAFSQDSPEVYANLCYAQTPKDYADEMRDLFSRRMSEVKNRILPCDSYYLATKIQDEMGMHTFMPEVGCQIPLMRLEIALARGVAKSSKKTWGTYYECWKTNVYKDKKALSTMPCFNSDPSNEWYLTQETHKDDFTTYGENGGSSRLLQNRIYYYSLMSGTHYIAEEWGLNCSYTDMNDFTLSEYGIVKKNFINTALKMQNIKAHIPFAIVLPKDFNCIELPVPSDPYKIGVHSDTYMRCALSEEQKAHYGHMNDVLKLIFQRINPIGNEGHVITNSRFGDLFDIIYDDASCETLSQYEYLIDATKDSAFINAKGSEGLKILDSSDIFKLENQLKELIKAVMPCYADDLCWLVSYGENGERYLSVFNNEGNERCFERGDLISKEADANVKVTFKVPSDISIITQGKGDVSIERIDDFSYNIAVPAAGFVILKF